MSSEADGSYMDGQFLIAMPTMEDGRFAHSVIYLCAHSDEGAMGIVLNQPANNITFEELLSQLEIIPEDGGILLPNELQDMQVHRGGPVETGRGFVLHTDDFYIESSSLPINDGVCLTATVEILRALAEGRGPKQAMLALGYAGWAPGQLEAEIHANGWLTCRADPSLIFDVDSEDKWRTALGILGIDPGMLSSEAGHA
ncbi:MULTISPECIES: YqgE/AlgH family protein [Pseudovibrio]|uniref:YqgE/AlgH family protein n=1 Tax=Stappiaceae TaxID=2821832 RepID=UPI002366C257|nr:MULTISPECIES: YqgE/AlgH family protein [Pseudovibrio]MDD7911292.1 YqgE/AlgH family protein [Pseudovibrio exalbescens]MDX5593021.1 YqgE/AlgH family protein [Pseudovibrio sp. SPO723]